MNESLATIGEDLGVDKAPDLLGQHGHKQRCALQVITLSRTPNAVGEPMIHIDFEKRVCESSFPIARQSSWGAHRCNAPSLDRYLVNKTWGATKLWGPEIVIDLDAPYCRLQNDSVDHYYTLA
jgi:hypothetical protein